VRGWPCASAHRRQLSSAPPSYFSTRASPSSNQHTAHRLLFIFSRARRVDHLIEAHIHMRAPNTLHRSRRRARSSARDRRRVETCNSIGTFSAVSVSMVPQTSVRNALVCKRCSSRLVVACEPSKHETAAVHTFSFACPACRGWNSNVTLSGVAVERVFLDPRARLRAEDSPPA
jgi:hypothetical protein